VEFWKIFPNTFDDANLEYVEFRNTGCEEVDISGYIFADLSGKSYTIPAGTRIAAHETFQLSRIISKIILNNEDEVLFLKNPA
jgi:Lamin Tail Domain